MTVFWTVFAGVSVYVVGELLMRFIVDPIHQQRETVGKVASFLIYHGNRFTSPGIPQQLIDAGNDEEIRRRKARLEETHEVGRNLATELVVRTQSIPCYSWLERVGWAPKRAKIAEAQGGLFAITNSLYDIGSGIQNYKRAKAVEQALGIVTEFRIPETKKPAAAETADPPPNA
ncbi:MAG: hypothetical protein ACREQ8_06655 [Woeseiaceae bacterium]